MIYLPLDAFEVTGPEGTWRLDFWAEDIEGNLSDTYTFTYTVTQ